MTAPRKPRCPTCEYAEDGTTLRICPKCLAPRGPSCCASAVPGEHRKGCKKAPCCGFAGSNRCEHDAPVLTPHQEAIVDLVGEIFGEIFGENKPAPPPSGARRNECKHGALGRSCERCDDEAEIAALRAEVERLKDLVIPDSLRADTAEEKLEEERKCCSATQRRCAAEKARADAVIAERDRETKLLTEACRKADQYYDDREYNAKLVMDWKAKADAAEAEVSTTWEVSDAAIAARDAAIAERDALAEKVKTLEFQSSLDGTTELTARVATLERALTCDCGHGPRMHHKAISKPHPESADTYCECGCEDYTPGRSFAAAALETPK
jgi:hypothetical protein